MSSNNKKIWKSLLIILCLIILLLVCLLFSNRGLIHLYRAELEHSAYLDKIQRLARENQVLRDEIKRLRTDMEYIKYVARNELNLIEKNEVIYKFNKKKGLNKDDLEITSEPRRLNKKQQSKKERLSHSWKN